jgi:N-acetylneuraminate synthase
MNPKTWREMVNAANELYLALGDGVKRIEENELQTSSIQRRGLRFTRDLKKGQIITNEDVFPLRPFSNEGLPPYKISEIIGKKLSRDVVSDEHIQPTDILNEK